MERVSDLIETDSVILLSRNRDSYIKNKGTVILEDDSVLESGGVLLQDGGLLKGDDSSSNAAISEIWLKVSSYIRPEIDEKIYNAWFRSLNLKSIDISREDGSKKAKVKFSVPNKFSRDHIKSNYSRIIENCFHECLGYPTSLEFVVEAGIVDAASPVHPVSSSNTPDTKSAAINMKSAGNTKPLANTKLGGTGTSSMLCLKRQTSRPLSLTDNTNLNSEYNFSNFVIGSCNQFAHAACLKVSESPGTSYNPLLIYGGVGLGKTHLANAVGNSAKRRGKKVLLASSETFVSELIASLRTNTMDKFKSKFRSLDILIIDDIQFIIGKERTQEEFFHTFNELYGKKKQIIITSDKLPQEMIGLEERLRTRFASGLSVDLQAPDFETRVAILTKKAELNGLEIPYDIARVIANRIDTNVRELEGAFTRMRALCSLLGEKPSLEIAQKVIDTIAPSKNRDITTEGIKQIVAKHFNVSINDLSGKRRTQNIALARQVAMYLCRKHTARSFPEIGALFGGRDHSTVIHAIKAVGEKIQTDSSLKSRVESITSLLEK